MLFLQAATLIPWAVAGLVIGAITRDRREAVLAGATYGFVLGFSFMVFGYDGTDPVVAKVPFFALLGIVSAGFAVTLSLAGRWIRSRLGSQSGGTAT
jgi:hypothetical protein